jgi:hypothetical protein
MVDFITDVVGQLDGSKPDKGLQAASAMLTGLVEEDAYVGEVYSLGYEEALVQIHDYHRQQVGGIPALSFLIATRITPSKIVDIRKEDASLILLRVLDKANLPNADEALRVRVENAQRVSGEVDKHWDDRGVMDPTTHNLLSYAGVRCRVLGTYFITNLGDDLDAHYHLSFGADLSNYYPNRGLKVFKPRGRILEAIANFRNHQRSVTAEGKRVRVGEVRYASSHRPFQQVDGVPVEINPTDLLGQKTALFGITRTGKSNTTKIMLKSIFALRWQPDPLRIGQIVFDPNGEYANENEQDAAGKSLNSEAIKNVWKCGPTPKQGDLAKDVATYGITTHPNDPKRNLMLLNFHRGANLEIGKEIINETLADQTAIYMRNFRDVVFDPPGSEIGPEGVRYRRRVLCYRALLSKAGLEPPGNIRPQTKGLFNSDLLDDMDADAKNNRGKDSAAYGNCATILRKSEPHWGNSLRPARSYGITYMMIPRVSRSLIGIMFKIVLLVPGRTMI